MRSLVEQGHKSSGKFYNTFAPTRPCRSQLEQIARPGENVSGIVRQKWQGLTFSADWPFCGLAWLGHLVVRASAGWAGPRNGLKPARRTPMRNPRTERASGGGTLHAPAL